MVRDLPGRGGEGGGVYVPTLGHWPLLSPPLALTSLPLDLVEVRLISEGANPSLHADGGGESLLPRTAFYSAWGLYLHSVTGQVQESCFLEWVGPPNLTKLSDRALS